MTAKVINVDFEKHLVTLETKDKENISSTIIVPLDAVDNFDMVFVGDLFALNKYHQYVKLKKTPFTLIVEDIVGECIKVEKTEGDDVTYLYLSKLVLDELRVYTSDKAGCYIRPGLDGLYYVDYFATFEAKERIKSKMDRLRRNSKPIE